MWSLNNQTPFQAERGWCRDRAGAEVWIVAVKATFLVDHPGGPPTLHEDQEAVTLAPEFRGAGSQSCLTSDTDLSISKSATDVLVRGSAFSPRGKPAPYVDVALSIGRRIKRLRVTGNRVWIRRLTRLVPSAPEPFITMPVEYERAYGGVAPDSNGPGQEWDERNPVGRGFYLQRSGAVGRPLPNVEYRESPVRRWKQRPSPAGFAPVAGHWKPRVSHIGTFDADWQAHRAPLLPNDFDDRFYQSAPLDQQVLGHLRGGERIVLQNMSPEGRFELRVPRVSVGVTTDFERGPSVHRSGKIHTVHVYPSERRFTVTWQVSLECHERANFLRESNVYVKHAVGRVAARSEDWIR